MDFKTHHVQQPVGFDPGILRGLVCVPADEQLEIGGCGDGGVIHGACLVYRLALQCGFNVAHVVQGQHSVLSLDIARGVTVVRGAVSDALAALCAARGEAALAVAGRAAAAGLHCTAVRTGSAATIHVRSGGGTLGTASVVRRLRWGIGPSTDIVLEEVVDLNARDLRAASLLGKVHFLRRKTDRK